MTDQLLLSAHVAAVWFCTGLVWIVQVLVYPGFADVGDSPRWHEVHERHTRAMAWIVTGPWAVQGLTCAWLLIARPVPLLLVLTAAVCGATTVVVTTAVSVPCHQRLSRGYDPVVLRRLVRTNWYRTAAWTLGGLAALAM